jgi:hypothetical protein
MTAFSHSVGSLLSASYRCASPGVEFALTSHLGPSAGYFRTADGLICYGRLSKNQPAVTANGTLPEAHADVAKETETVRLPFDPAEVVANLRLEKYDTHSRSNEEARGSLIRRLYYLLRPAMPVGVRKHLQRLSLRGWERIPFPQWPVDRSVDRLHEWLLSLAMEAKGVTEIPFVWFWPEGCSSCASITHDVETAAGRDFCGQLMDLNDSYDIKTSFQVVPEERYQVSAAFLNSLWERGFEVNVHDLNHDGNLFFGPFEQFREKAERINRHGQEFGARGFRSAVLYHKLEWMHELKFLYDMSVPSVGHLDPQRGGCCTVMPYLINDLLEIPVTTTQDYSLFHILGDYSTRLWEKQISAIMQAHGMATFIIHPDYVIDSRAREVYQRLLKHLSDLRTTSHLWITKPGEINDWWRARARMELARDGDTWRVVGKGSERARVAFARADGGEITYRLQQTAACTALGSR